GQAVIRINLLEETRVQAKAKGGGGFAMPTFQVAENVPVFILVAGMAVAAGAVGVVFMYNKIALDKKAAEISAAQAEVRRLESILAKNDELEAKKAELTKR